VLAPLLIAGGALGALEDHFLPGGGHGLWALISMAAVFGGTMRAPLTSVVFAFELTQDTNALLPLLLASTIAHAMSVLVLKRSILTEKVARRGYHLKCEYEIDPLECVTVSQRMTKDVDVLQGTLPLREVIHQLHNGAKHQGYPVVSSEGRLLGVVTRGTLIDNDDPERPVAHVLSPDVITVTPDDTCRTAAELMAINGVGRLPVLDGGRLVGIITRSDVMSPRAQAANEEQKREAFFRVGRPDQPIMH
jgi:CBS domain-containing protein